MPSSNPNISASGRWFFFSIFSNYNLLAFSHGKSSDNRLAQSFSGVFGSSGGYFDRLSVTLGQNVEKINSLSLEALQLNNAYYKQNAYNAMVETGDMRLYEDVELRDDIISLYEYYAWAKGIDEATLETYTTYYYPYAVENFDLINGEPQAIEKYNNRKFSNILAGYSYMMKFRIEKQKELLEKTTEFLDKYDHSSD